MIKNLWNHVTTFVKPHLIPLESIMPRRPKLSARKAIVEQMQDMHDSFLLDMKELRDWEEWESGDWWVDSDWEDWMDDAAEAPLTL